MSSIDTPPTTFLPLTNSVGEELTPNLSVARFCSACMASSIFWSDRQALKVCSLMPACLAIAINCGIGFSTAHLVCC